MSKKETRQQAVMRLLGEGKDIKQVAEEMGIKVQLARSYKWRAENPEKYKTMLKRYFEKRKARLAAEKKSKPKKEKKAKVKQAKKAEKPAEAKEAPAEEPTTEKRSLEESPPPNPWK